MESGLEGRNNETRPRTLTTRIRVSMESGLEGRNNGPTARARACA